MKLNQEIDILLIGAGPSNIALAIAIEELDEPVGSVVMLEAGTSVTWHPGMLFPEAQSQVSFLKDLVTLRDPTSRFTFLNFLHQTGRLGDFVNLQSFFPYRREISDYLRWCSDQLQKVKVRCSSHVTSVRPIINNEGKVVLWEVVTANGREYMAKRVVYGAGRQANVPEPFVGISSERVIHASRLIEKLNVLAPDTIKTIGIIGGAQSAAEAYQECLRRFPFAHVHLIMRSIGLVPYGGSKFTNDLYSDAFVDSFFSASESTRRRVLAAMHDSNYAGVAPSTLDSLFRLHYLQRMEKNSRAEMHTQCQILDATQTSSGISMHWTEGANRHPVHETFDLVVLGTGYQNNVPPLLQEVVRNLDAPALKVTRNYRAEIACAPGVSLHTLGVNEATHGISDSLLSVIGTRAQLVLEDMMADIHPESSTIMHVAWQSGTTFPPQPVAASIN